MSYLRINSKNVRYLITAFITVVCVSTTCAQDKELKAFSVGFYNLENLFDTQDNPDIRDEEFLPDGDRLWNQEKYNDKIANLASVIAQLSLEVCREGISLLGVSEIENKAVLEDLVQHPLLASRNYGIVHRESSDERGIDVALIYDADVFEPLNISMHKVDISTLGSSRPTRDVLLVSGTLDGELIHITVNHWPSRSGGEKRSAKYRNLAAQVNRTIVDSLLQDDPAAKIILLGDFNDDPNNDSLTKYLRAKHKMKATGEDDLYNPMMDFYKKGQGTTAYRDRWSLFDQLVVSHGLIDKDAKGLRFHKASIFNKKYLITRFGKYKGYPFRTFDFDEYQGGYSDHFPVYLYLVKEI